VHAKAPRLKRSEAYRAKKRPRVSEKQRPRVTENDLPQACGKENNVISIPVLIDE
jgi:hypothetical protein